MSGTDITCMDDWAFNIKYIITFLDRTAMITVSVQTVQHTRSCKDKKWSLYLCCATLTKKRQTFGNEINIIKLIGGTSKVASALSLLIL